MALLTEAEDLRFNGQHVDRMYKDGVEITFTPKNLPDLIGWYDDKSPKTVSGGLIGQWNDKSPAGNHLTATGVFRPADDTLGGLQVARFTPNDRMLAPGLDAPLNGQSSFTIFGVVKATTAVASAFLWGTNPNSSSKGCGWFASADGLYLSIRAWNTIDSPVYTAGTAVPNNSSVPFLLAQSWDIAARRIRFKYNGGAQVSVGPGGAPVAGASGTYALGGRAGTIAATVNSIWCEKIICARVLTAKQIAQTEKYLNDKWNIY